MADDRRHPVKLLDQNAVADMYGVCSKTIDKWERTGAIPKVAVKRKNFKRWLYSDIAAHIEGMAHAELQEAAS